MTLPTRPGAGLGGFAAYWKDDWTGLPDCHLDVRDLGGRRIPTNRLVVISTPALDGPALR